MVLAMIIGQGSDVISNKKTGFQLGWRLFCWGHVNLNWKSVPISVDTFIFCWRSPIFGDKNRLNSIEDRLKSRSRSFDVASSLQNTPPTLQIPGYAPDLIFEQKSAANLNNNYFKYMLFYLPILCGDKIQKKFKSTVSLTCPTAIFLPII